MIRLKSGRQGQGRHVATAIRAHSVRLHQAMIFTFSAVLIVLRRPDAVTNPQFFSEDLAIWYADAYQHNWLTALLVPYAGYFQVLPRLAAAVSLLVPLHLAPLVLNLIGISIQCLPVCYLLSVRSAEWGSLPCRVSLALGYLLLPNSSEVHVTVTNAQWHLSVLAILLLVGQPAHTKSECWFDRCILALCGLTGPFCILLSVFAWFRERDKPLKEHTSILMICSVVQIIPILCTAGILRSAKPTGASVALLLRLIGGHLTLGLLRGENELPRTAPATSLVLAAVFGLVLTLHAVRVGCRPLRITILFASLLLASALKNPLVIGKPTWDVLAGTVALRYWYVPTLAFTWALIWCCFYSRARMARIICMATLACSLPTILKEFRLPPYPETGFCWAARSFETAPSGTSVTVPAYPRFWDVIIQKH